MFKMISLFKSVYIHTDANLGTIKISSKPDAYFIVFLIACLFGLCALPFTEYSNDYFAYISLIYVLVLTAYFCVVYTQVIIFEDKANIRVRKGFSRWNIPFEAVTAGYTTYEKRVSQASRERTHYLNFELKVNLPDNQKHSIRNGTANIFHYGFRYWGKEQDKIWDKFNDILKQKGIANLAQK